jgi:hypothetical protein
MSIRPLFLQHDRSPASRNCSPQAASDFRPVERAKELSATQGLGASIWLTWVAMLAVAFATLVASIASGQNPNSGYDSIKMHAKLEDEAVVKSVAMAAKNYATTGQGDPRLANGYFSVYIPAKMTAPDGIKYITELVDETNNLLLRAQRSNRPQVAQQLTLYIFNGMKKVAEGNYHPAARINAALVLARLDRRPANPANRTPPVPLPQTLPIMISLYENESNADGIRAAALQGLHRQVTLGFPQITPEDRTKITAMMTSLLDSPAPEGRPADAHAFLQRYAVDILDVLRANEDKSLGTKLISISTEPSNPDLIALYSASRLAALGPEMKGQVKEPKKVLDSWAKRVLGAFEGELARLDDYLKKPESIRSQPVKPETFLEKKKTETAATPASRTGMMGEMDMEMGYDMDMDMMPDMDEMDMGMSEMDMMSMMMMGGGRRATEKPQPPEVLATRKRLNKVLQQVQLGVTGKPTAGVPTRDPGGILASVPDDQKQVIEDWVTQLETVITELNDKTLDDEKKFREGLVTQVEALRELAGIEAEAEPDVDSNIPGDFAPVDPLAGLNPVAPAPPGQPGADDPAPAKAPANNVPNEFVTP